MGERTIGKYSFLTKLIWAIFRPFVVRAAEDKTDDTFNSDTVDAIDAVVNMDHVEIYKEIEGK